jgi:hypothetical protein
MRRHLRRVVIQNASHHFLWNVAGTLVRDGYYGYAHLPAIHA